MRAWLRWRDTCACQIPVDVIAGSKRAPLDTHTAARVPLGDLAGCRPFVLLDLSLSLVGEIESESPLQRADNIHLALLGV
jgi:hypothetical protein